jgi:hypothetical protein
MADLGRPATIRTRRAPATPAECATSGFRRGSMVVCTWASLCGDGVAGRHTRRSADKHWPDRLTPTDADLFAHSEIVIQAAPQQICQHLIAATAWPRCYSHSANVVVNDPSEFLAGGVIDWSRAPGRSRASATCISSARSGRSASWDRARWRFRAPVCCRDRACLIQHGWPRLAPAAAIAGAGSRTSARISIGRPGYHSRRMPTRRW